MIKPNALDFGKKFHFGSSLKSIVILCLLLIGIRFIFVVIMGIMPQDAYYDFYAQHLDLSYYDHPPLIGYLLRLFTSLFGKKVYVLKLADTLVTLLTIIAFYNLTRKFLSKNKALIAVALLLSTLMISILSLVSTPDVPLMLCWTISINFLHEAIFKRKYIYWLWAGIFTGLSFDSKYTAVFLIIGLIGFLLMAKPFRKLLISKWFFIYLICFAITILPVVIWNALNGFASFKFQSEGRAQEGLHVDFTGFVGVIGHQSAILLPFLFFHLYILYFVYAKNMEFGSLEYPQISYFFYPFLFLYFSGFFSFHFFIG